MALPVIEASLLALLVRSGPIAGTAQVGYALWPERRMQAQGAALAAGKVIRGLRDRGLLSSFSHGPKGMSSRYEVTEAGRTALAERENEKSAQLGLLN